MGNQICVADQTLDQHQARSQITTILQDFPSILRGSMFRGTTTRYNDLSVLHEDYNRYIFVLKSQGHKEMRVVIPVLNELAHRALHPNYKLKIDKQAIIDPFDDQFESTLFPVRNQSAGLEYSMRIIPFKSYNNASFKRVLQQIWIYQTLQRHYELNRNKSTQDPRLLFLWLQDYFVYGVNTDRQAMILLYERTQNSLLLGAEYREKAKMPWTLSQKLKITRDILMGCIRLHQVGISHRDIRASNIFYVEKQQRYMLGGFSCGRDTSEDQQLLTVNGIEIQSEGHLRQLLSQKQNMGLYRTQDNVYTNLKVLNRLLQNRRIGDEYGPYSFKQRLFANIDETLTRKQSLVNILKTVQKSIKQVERAGEFSEEVNIARKIPALVPQWYVQKCENFLFQAYSCLGYQIQFSEMAHKIIERNNIEQRPFDNAVILKNLGLFYEKYGTGGSEYLLNSCILYCKQADYEIERGLFDDAQSHIEEGEEIYIKLSTMGDFPLSMIELKRLRAQLRARTVWRISNAEVKQAQIQDILTLMGKTLTLAGQQNLPIQKQMKMFLTWGVVHRDCGDRSLAEERFKNGLAVCQNPGAFQSQTTASLTKAHFLYEMSIMDLQLLHSQHDPLLPQQAQNYSPADLPKRIQENLQQALNLRQKQTTRIYQVVQCNLALGELYLLLNEFLQANVQLKRALIQLQDLRKREKIPYDTMVQLHYDLGSINYKLQGYSDAIEYYKQALKILEQNGGDKYWSHVISGNLGLAYLRVNQGEKGKPLLQRAKQYIKNQNGTNHYDYLFLNSQEELIGRNKL